MRRATSAGLKAAVHRSKPLTRAGVLERLFTLAFERLVYPQIWEDPVVDMAALEIGPGHEVIAIASGGCNVLSYLTADPAGVTAVDLNGAHIALGKLKICALQNLPDYETFFRFFGRADARANVAAYDRRLRMKLDPADARLLGQAPRVRAPAHRPLRPQLLPSRPARPFPRRGPHARRACMASTPRSCSRRGRSTSSARSTRSALRRSSISRSSAGSMKQPASLYGLGIPPAQYKALAADSPAGSARC